jgi:hypothetical protein
VAHVKLLVADGLLDDLAEGLELLRASEVDREPVGDRRTAFTLDMAYAPDGAAWIEPVFERTPDGVRVQSIQWSYPDADPDDPPTMCWHIEPTTPCDWNICRQPERLAVGDYGTDPAESAKQRTT